MQNTIANQYTCRHYVISHCNGLHSGAVMSEENRGSDEWHYELCHGHHRQDSIASTNTLDHVTDDSLATHSVQQAKGKGAHENKQNSLL